MHRKVLTFSLAIAMSFVSPAFAADNDTEVIGFNGTVENTCVLDPLTQVSSSGASLDAGATSSSATITFDGFADGNTAQFIAGSGIGLQVAGYCNYPHTIRVQTTNGSFQHQTAANQPVAGSGTFIDEILYDVVIFGWNGVLVQLDAQGVPGTKSTNGNVNGAFRGSASMAITLTNPGPDPLLAGQWSDTLTLQIGQAL